MGLAKLQSVVSFTSEDAHHPASNLLLQGNGSRKWLCAPSHSSSRLEVVLQLDRASAIETLDVGNHGSATVEAWVGMSCWDSTQPLCLLMPAAVLMSPADSKAGTNLSSVRMFSAKEHFCQETKMQMWDRLRIVCTQPHSRGRQFGLAFVCVGRKEEAAEELSDSEIDKSLMDLSSQPSPSSPRFPSHTPPTPMSRASRIMSLRKSNLSPSSPKPLDDSIGVDPSLQRMSPAARRNALCLADTSHGNSASEDAKGTKGVSGNRRKRPLEQLEPKPHEEEPEAKHVDNKSADVLVECPLCSGFFAAQDIEVHAANCQGTSDCEEIEPTDGECPICRNTFPSQDLVAHADACAVQNFGES